MVHLRSQLKGKLSVKVRPKGLHIVLWAALLLLLLVDVGLYISNAHRAPALVSPQQSKRSARSLHVKEQAPLGSTPMAPHVDVIVNPQTVSFARQPIGRLSSRQNIHVVNLGTAPLTVTRTVLVGTSARSFSASDSCTGKPISAYTGCDISIRFLPRTVGSAHASLVIAVDKALDTEVVHLTGNGVRVR